jgi:hypothetical protein
MPVLQDGPVVLDQVRDESNGPIVLASTPTVADATGGSELIVDRPHWSAPDPKAAFRWHPVA